MGTKPANCSKHLWDRDCTDDCAPEEDEELDRNHIDHFIWNRFMPDDKAADPYAQFILMYFRLPAVMQIRWRPFFEGKRLFCTYMGGRVEVVGASRLGPVLLRGLTGSARASPNECSEWSPVP